MKNIVLISASPKIHEPSSSREFLELAGSRLHSDQVIQTFFDVRKSITRHQAEADYQTISQADALIVSFPLYVFCLPGILMRYLQDYHRYYLKNGKAGKNPKVYAIVNCGFPEPAINLEAIRVIESFCRQINADFRFGILIGGGAALLGAKKAPFMKKPLQKLQAAFSGIAEDIQLESSVKDNQLEQQGEEKNIFIDINLPRRFYFFMGTRGWYMTARKNGLKKKDLYRKPYRLS